MTSMLRADLHVHTSASIQAGTLKFLRSRDSYSSPEAVYRTAKARGMDLVAITDHDSIAGAIALLNGPRALDDVIVGEEVSCWLAEGRLEVHLGVYGMTEQLHRQIQPLRGNACDVAAALREADVFFALNHLLHFYRGQMPFDDYLRFLDEVPALEVRNGTMLAGHNELIERLAARAPSGRRLAMTAGSDAHTLRRIGRTWTEAPGSTRDEFMQSLRAGLGRPCGVHGVARDIYGDAYGVVSRYVGSLLGFGPRDHRGWERAGCLAFSMVTLPGQFVPVLIAMKRKGEEARAVNQARRLLADGTPLTASLPVAAEQ